jgi:hypothetical protein
VNDDERDVVYRRFRDAVNMSPRQLESWLETDESKAVGEKKARTAESIGHRSGRRIVTLLRTRKSGLTPSDVAHMRKVAGFVARRLAQRPAGDVRRTRYRYSLMNWGHDPLAQ